MSCELFSLLVFGVLDPEPVVAGGHWRAVVVPVPSVPCRADLLEELPVAVEDVYPCGGVCLSDAYDVPCVVVPVSVGGHEPWVVDDPDLNGDAAAPVGVTDGDGVPSGLDPGKGRAVLEWPVVELEHVLSGPLRGDLYDVLPREGPAGGGGSVLHGGR